MNLDYPDLEILVVTNSPLPKEYPGVVQLITTEEAPAAKRDVAIKAARGDICAFLDDDAYPRGDWLSNAALHFKQLQVVAVGGPAVTPEDDDLMRKASGIVYSTLPLSHRYVPKQNKWVDELPTCNLLVRRSVLLSVGGFGTRLRSGGDSLLCAKLLAAGGKALYANDVVVYHHRRPLLTEHVRQVWGYGLHRGWLAKKRRSSSHRPIYFLPALVLIATAVLTFLSAFDRLILSLTLSALAAVSVVILILSTRFTRQPILILLSYLGVLATILTYGCAFLKGLLSSEIVYGGKDLAAKQLGSQESDAEVHHKAYKPSNSY